MYIDTGIGVDVVNDDLSHSLVCLGLPSGWQHVSNPGRWGQEEGIWRDAISILAPDVLAVLASASVYHGRCGGS